MGKSLDARPGLRAAVKAIEARQADVLAVAYLDRLTRDPRVRDEVVDRVEAAGGEVWTVDMGRQTNGTAAEQHAEFRLPRAENPRGLGPAGQLCRRNDGPVEFLDERDLNTYTSGGGRIGCSWIRPR